MYLSFRNHDLSFTTMNSWKMYYFNDVGYPVNSWKKGYLQHRIFHGPSPLLQAGDGPGQRRERRRVGRRAFDGVAEYLGGERILGISAWEFGDLVMQKNHGQWWWMIVYDG